MKKKQKSFITEYLLSLLDRQLTKVCYMVDAYCYEESSHKKINHLSKIQGNQIVLFRSQVRLRIASLKIFIMI